MKTILASLFALVLTVSVTQAQNASNVYMENLPTAAYLLDMAKVQGFKVESITQTADRVVEKCTTSVGEVTFVYRTFASLNAQTGAQMAPAMPQPSTPPPPYTMDEQGAAVAPASVPVYYPYYGYDLLAPLALGLDLGWYGYGYGWCGYGYGYRNGGYRGGYRTGSAVRSGGSVRSGGHVGHR